ncbi:MAG: acetate--CoA ligase family protein [Hyphomicrobiales bacterium]
MTAARRNNLKRLLAPRHIAVVGGTEAAHSVRLSRALGFEGPVWGVNPKRSEIGDAPCFAAIEDLPEAPDAVFLAIPRTAAVDAVRRLRAIGAGGVICYAAGFRELGAEGAELEAALVDAAGDLALVGPNCFGTLNFVAGAALWPYDHGGGRVERGVAIVSQSGMLSSNLTMNRRSVPIAHVIGAGNQAVLGIEDYLDVLVDDPAVTAIGLYIEQLRDVARFSDAALRALEAGTPIVAMKAGASDIAARLTVTHTGSLSGSDHAYQALFDRLGVIRVVSPVLLMETLKMLTVAGVPAGRRLAAFTCSGGDAAMLADYAQVYGLTFAPPSPPVAARLKPLLPEIATVSNPLDYTTPLWGNAKSVTSVVSAVLADGHDAALMVQDYPAVVADADRSCYENDTQAFITATRAAGVPAAVCSNLPENLDRPARDIMSAGAVAPLQGIEEAVAAIACAVRYGERRAEIMALDDRSILGLKPPPPSPPDVAIALDEWQGKQAVATTGIPIPRGRLCDADMSAWHADELGYPVAVKRVDAALAHKSEAGAVHLGLKDAGAVEKAVAAIGAATSTLGTEPHRFLVEQMITDAVAELLVSVRRDDTFGHVLVIAGGGIVVELLDDAKTLLLPTDRARIAEALYGLNISPLIDGYRGRPPGDRDAAIDAILAVARLAHERAGDLIEIEINPLMVRPVGVAAVDVLMRVSA